MIATEFKTPTATIRIHDEFFETATDGCISQLSRIVTESYKRRKMQDDALAALNTVVKDKQV